MIFSVYGFSIAFSILFLLVIFELVRKSRLLEKYSLLWILFGVIILVLSASPNFIEGIAGFFSIKYAPSVLFLFGLIYLLIYCLNITVMFSKQAQRITRLSQELALLKENTEYGKKDAE